MQLQVFWEMFMTKAYKVGNKDQHKVKQQDEAHKTRIKALEEFRATRQKRC